jgi:YggT family protein
LIEVSLIDVLGRTVNSVLTIYMALILLRWLAPWLKMDVEGRRFRWAWRLTDPLIGAMRRVLPPMGPVDFGPIAALFVVWIVRIVATGMFARVTVGV